MRVISKIKDYWDTAGIVDRSLVWARPQDLANECEYLDRRYKMVHLAAIGFCGMEYPFIIVEEVKWPHNLTHIHYDLPSFLMANPDLGKWRNLWGFKAEATDHFRPRHRSDALFIELKTPIYLSTSRGVFPNILLKTFQFYKIKSAPEAFHEVQNYLTNVIFDAKPMIEIEDKYKIAGHGFDKFSFRHPTKLK